MATTSTTFVRLGRSVWFTLESSFRSADPSRANALEERLAMAGQFIEVLSCDNDLLKWSERHTWSNEKWTRFLKTFDGGKSSYFDQVFRSAGSNDDTDDTTTNKANQPTEEEKELLDAFDSYMELATEENDDDEKQEDLTKQQLSDARKHVDIVLGKFADRLGDPTVPCQNCGKCALGRKLLRCSRCKLVWYCSQTCQKENWKSHKRACKPILQRDPKQVDKLVRDRYYELRRQGKSVKIAMEKARCEYDQDKADASANSSANTQVAAMFGIH